MAAGICERLRLANQQKEYVVDLVRNHLRFMDVAEMRESTLRRFLGNNNIQDHLELHRLDCLASHGDLTSYRFCKRKLEEYAREIPAPEPLLTGRDLIALGHVPGPLFSKILTSVEDRRLERTLRTKEEALEFVRQNFPIEEKTLG